MANGISLANAYVSLSVSADKIAPQVNKHLKGIERDAESTGRRSGKKMSAGMAAGVGKAAGKMFAPVAAAATAFAGMNLFKDMISGASELEQSIGGVAAVFGKSQGEIEKAAKGAAQNLGLSRDEYNKLATTLGAGLKNKGVEDYAQSTQDLISIGGDLAAQFGGSTKEAVEALSSAMRGESDPIERYGVALNETAVNAKLAEMGVKKAGGTYTEEQKTMARLALITEQTADAQGAFGREAETAAGRQAILAASWENIKTTVGTALLPAFSGAVNAVSDFVSGMDSGTGAGGRFRDFLAGLGGKIVPVFREISGVIQRVHDVVAPVISNFIEQFRAGEGAGGRLRDVLTAVRDAAVLAFTWVRDHAVKIIGALTEQFKAGEGAGGSLRVGLERIWSVAQDAFGFFRDEGLPALKNLWDFIVRTLWPDLKVAFIDRIWPAMKEVGQAIWDFWNADAKPALEGLWKFIRDTLAPFLVAFYEEGVKPTFKGIGDVIETAYKFAKTVLRNFQTEVQALRDRFVAVRDGIRDAWRGLSNIIARPINAVIDKVNAFLNGLKSALNKIPGVDLTGNWTIRKIILDTASGTIGGGPNQMLASGGRVAGYSPHDRADNIPAMLTAGEYVLPVAATRSLASRFGPGFLEALRQGLPGFASGGAVSHGNKRTGGYLADGWEWIADLVSNASGWVKRKFESLLDGIGSSWPAQAARGAAMSGIEGLAGWIKANIFGGGDPSGNGMVNYGGPYGWAPGGGLPWQAIWSMIKMVAPESVMTSNYRPGAITASGVPSLHGQGRAVDIVSSNMRETFLKLLPLLKWSQLFYSPMGGLQVGYRDAIVHRTHFDHIHAALADGGFVRPPVFDRGGTLAPGFNLIDNQTGGPESLRNADLPVDLSDLSLSALRDLFVEAAVRGAEKAHQLELMGVAR